MQSKVPHSNAVQSTAKNCTSPPRWVGWSPLFWYNKLQNHSIGYDMKREEAKRELDLARNGRHGENRRIEMMGVIDRIYDDFESMVCRNCKWYTKEEVCVRDDSLLCCEFVHPELWCNKFERG